MKILLTTTAALFCVLVSTHTRNAQQMAQDVEVVIMPTGEAILHWQAKEGRTYFIQGSDANDPLGTWIWSDYIEHGHDHEISHEVGSTSDKAFFRLHYTDTPPPAGVTLEAWDADGDGLSNALEISLPHQGNPLNPDTDGDGIPDGWAHAHGLPLNSSNASGLFQGGPATNQQAYQQGVQANPNATIDDHDADEVENDFDAVPDDSEINWQKNPVTQYVWIEQMTTPTDSIGGPIPPIAVNSSGQVLYAGYTAGQYDSTSDPPRNALWDSATRQWMDLPPSGSQTIQADTDCAITVTDQAGGFIDINDAGTVSALGRGVSSTYPSTVGAHWIGRTQPSMIWEKTGGATPGYGPPKYYIYHPDHPKHPDPVIPGDTSYRDDCWCELDLTAHAGSSYQWNFWRPPGGRIGIDGSTNLIAHISGETTS
jgi:Bacterial TSP3 repeat